MTKVILILMKVILMLVTLVVMILNMSNLKGGNFDNKADSNDYLDYAGRERGDDGDG